MENTVLGGEQFLKRGYSEAIVKVCFVAFDEVERKPNFGP